MEFLKMVLSRLKEPSTYSGIGISTAGVSIWDSTSPLSVRIASGVMIFAGVVSSFLPESGAK